MSSNEATKQCATSWGACELQQQVVPGRGPQQLVVDTRQNAQPDAQQCTSETD